MPGRIQGKQNARENRKERIRRREMRDATPMCGRCRKSLALHPGGKPCG